MKPLLCSILLTAVFAPVVGAHDLYLLPERFRVDLGASFSVAFHNGDSFPESEVAPKPERLLDVTVSSSSGSGSISALHVSGTETIGTATAPGAGSLQLSVRTIPNFIELPADKFTAYLKEEGLTEIIDWRNKYGESARAGRERYQKFAKSFVTSGGDDGFFLKPLGLTIEIIPLKDPSALHAGTVLPVRVLLRGKPARGLQVESAWAGDAGKQVRVVGRTDAEGRVDVPLTNAGKWRLHALVMERRSDDKSTDWESYWASLTFAIQ